MKDKIKKIVKEEFNADLIDAVPTTGGYSHHMFFVKINKPPFEFLIRFSNLSEDKDKDLRKEIYVYNELSKLGVPVPKIIIFKKNEEKEEPDYAIIEKLKGKRLDTIWDNLSMSQRLEIAFKIGRLMRTIHALKLEKFGRLKENGEIEVEDKPFKFKSKGKTREHSKFLRHIYRGFLKDVARLISYENINSGDLVKIVNYIISNKKNINYRGKPVLIHGDLIPGHIFVDKVNDKYKITGLIDVEFAEPSCPEYDFIKLHRQGFFADPLLREALIKGYGKINEKAVEIFRMMRDTSFAQVLFESGDIAFGDKVLNGVLERINNSNLKIN